jgi:hypothetical protein
MNIALFIMKRKKKCQFALQQEKLEPTVLVGPPQFYEGS